MNNNIQVVYYVDVFLTKTQKNLGQFTSIKNNEIFGDLTTFNLIPNFNFLNQTQLPPFNFSQPFNVTVTGITESKLKNVITYTGDYKVGVNGVIFANSDYVMYEIDGITYTTFLSDNLTIYSVTKPTNEFDKQSILRDDNSVSIDVKKTLNAFLIDRSNVSIYEYFNKINNCDSLDDLLDIF
jgi:hypothetical protein